MGCYTGLKIAGLVADKYACGHYRMIFPLTYLQRAGADISILHEASSATLQNFDIIIAQRQTCLFIRDILENGHWAGKTVISEQDDLMHNVPNLTDSFKHYKNGSRELLELTNIMKGSDGITTTTPELALDYKQYSKHTYVLPNSLDFEIRKWPEPKFRDDRCVIGWSGSPSHVRDIQLIGPAVKYILEKYPHVTFAMACDRRLYELLVTAHDIPKDRTLYITPVSFEDYPSILPNFDIGLCPIENIPFNKSKSSLKMTELGGVGVPCVASRVAPYQRYCLQGIDGFTADGTSEWIEKLSLLIENPAKRKEMGEAAYARVRQDFNYANTKHLWWEAWTDIRFAAKIGDVGPGPKPAPPPGRNDPCPLHPNIKAKNCKCYPAFS